MDDGPADFYRVQEGWASRCSSLTVNASTHVCKWNAPEADVFFEPLSVAGGERDFTSVDEWGDFAYVDDDFIELVVGVGDTHPNGYSRLVDLIVQNGGELVNTVSIGGEIRAVVANVSSMVISAFVLEVQAACLSRYIEPIRKFDVDFVPNDSDWTLQWGPMKIKADYAWNTTIGDPSVLVAVIDTGIDWDHPDLAANYVPLGYDWVNNDTDPMDDHSHGTHCAGIVAAVMNNSIGVAGVAQVSIMAEKGLNAEGWGTDVDLANAIIHAVDQGAKVISCSWGDDAESLLLHEAIQYAYNSGVLLVASAGNRRSNEPHYPAAYEEVVAVTATMENDKNPQWTNFGSWVELAAPGCQIYSTVWNDTYAYKSGTSMSCPHVAGVAALVWSRFPNMSRDWVRLQLRRTAEDFHIRGFDWYFGYGRVNARRAVELVPAEHDLLILDCKRPYYVEPGKVGMVSIEVANIGLTNESSIVVQLSVNGSLVDSATIGFLASGSLAEIICSWNATVEGSRNVTAYVVPVQGETTTEGNIDFASVDCGYAVKAVVMDSMGTDCEVGAWDILNEGWRRLGTRRIYIDYVSLNQHNIKYDAIAATEADVLMISCAFGSQWHFTSSEIEAIKRYVYEGHGLIATSATLKAYDSRTGYVSGSNYKLAPLFGLVEFSAPGWRAEALGATATRYLHVLDETHPLVANISSPYKMPVLNWNLAPGDLEWSSNDLTGGTYVALGPHKEGAIVTYKGLVYLSPYLENLATMYREDRTAQQILYNAITWSRYVAPEHELTACVDCPVVPPPKNAVILNATVFNIGLNEETDVRLELRINGTAVADSLIERLAPDKFYRLSYSWAPSITGKYNITAYVQPVPGEYTVADNRMSLVCPYWNNPVRVCWMSWRPSVTILNRMFYYWIMKEGYLVTQRGRYDFEPINGELLSQYDILVLPNIQENLMSSEVSTIQEWVADGGALLILADVGYSAGLNVLMAPYGVCLTGRFSGLRAGSPPLWGGVTSNITSHPITENVGSIEYWAYAWEQMVNAPSEALAWTLDGYAFLSVTTEEDGRVVVLSDKDMLDFDHIADADNERLLVNIFCWLKPLIPQVLCVDPSLYEADVGDIFTLNLNVYDVLNLYHWIVTVEWNANILEFLQYEEGPFLKQDGNTTITDAAVSPGKITELQCMLLGEIPGVNGSGTLVTFTFGAHHSGATLIKTTLSDLIDSGGESITHDAIGSLVKVSPPKLTIYSSPARVKFTVDGITHKTPWSETYVEGSSLSLVMPENHTVGNTTYDWDHWSDGNTSRSRTVTVNRDTTLTAYFTGPYYELTVNSSPITGITFTIDEVPETTPYTEWLPEGLYTLAMPETHKGYVWSHWLEDGDTNRTKTITLSGRTAWTGVFALLGDLNYDGKVDITDLVLFIKAFGSYPTHPRWNIKADLNGDYKVDIQDLVLLIKNYGKHKP